MNPFRLLSSVGRRLSSNISPQRHKPSVEKSPDRNIGDTLEEQSEPETKRRKFDNDPSQPAPEVSITETIRDTDDTQDQVHNFESRIYNDLSTNIEDKQTSAQLYKENTRSLGNTKTTPKKSKYVAHQSTNIKPTLTPVENRAIHHEEQSTYSKVSANEGIPLLKQTGISTTPSKNGPQIHTETPQIHTETHQTGKTTLPAVPPSTPPSRLKRKRASFVRSGQTYPSPIIKGHATSSGGSPRVSKFPSLQRSSLLTLVPPDEDSDEDNGGSSDNGEPPPTAVYSISLPLTPLKHDNQALPSPSVKSRSQQTQVSSSPSSSQPQNHQIQGVTDNGSKEIHTTTTNSPQVTSRPSSGDDSVLNKATGKLDSENIDDASTIKPNSDGAEETPQRSSTGASFRACKTPGSVSDSKRKRVAFSDLQESNPSTNSSPSNGSEGHLKSILKPVISNDERTENHNKDEQPILKEKSLEEILNSFERALSSKDANTKRALYLTLGTVIMVNNEANVSKDMQYRLADILREMDADIERELEENTSPINRNISSAYKIAGYLLTIPEISKALDWKVGLNYIHRSISQLNKHNTDSKSQVFVHLKFLSSDLAIYSTVLQSTLIIDALRALKSLQYKNSMSILCEKLAIYERFVEKGGSYMLAESKSWMNEVITCLVHPSPTIRNRAIAVTNTVISKCSASSYDNGIVAHCVYSIFHSADRRLNPQVISVFVKRLHGLLRSGDVNTAMTIWGNILLLLQHQQPGSSETKVEQWEHLRAWMSVLRECFDIGTMSSRQAAFEALRKIVYLWAFPPLLSFYDAKDETKAKMKRRLETLLYAFKKDNGETNKTILLDIFTTNVYLTLRPYNSIHDQRLVHRIVWKNIIYPVITHWKEDKSMILKLAGILKNTLRPSTDVTFEPSRALRMRGYLETNDESTETLENYMCLPSINVIGESASVIVPNIFKMLILVDSSEEGNHAVLELWDAFLMAMVAGANDDVSNTKQSVSIMIGILSCTEFIAASMAELPSNTVSEIIKKFLLRVGFSRLAKPSLVFDYFEQKLSSTTTPAELAEKSKAFKSLKSKNLKPSRGGAEVEDLLNTVPNWNQQFSPLAYLYNVFAASYEKDENLTQVLVVNLVDQSAVERALFYKECINIAPVISHDERDKGLPAIWKAFAKPYLIEVSNFEVDCENSCIVLDPDTICILLEYIDTAISSFDALWAINRIFYDAFDRLYRKYYFRKHPDQISLVSRACQIFARTGTKEMNYPFTPADALKISIITSIFSVYGDVLGSTTALSQRDQVEFDADAFMFVVNIIISKTPYCLIQKSIIPPFLETVLFFLLSLLKGESMNNCKAKFCQWLIERIPQWLNIFESQFLNDSAASLVAFCHRMEIHKEYYTGVPSSMMATMAEALRGYGRRQQPALNENISQSIVDNRGPEAPFSSNGQTVISRTVQNYLQPQDYLTNGAGPSGYAANTLSSTTSYRDVFYTQDKVQTTGGVAVYGDIIPASVTEKSSTEHSGLNVSDLQQESSNQDSTALILAREGGIVVDKPSITSEEISPPDGDARFFDSLGSYPISRLFDSNLETLLQHCGTEDFFELESKLMDTLIQVRSLQKRKRNEA